MSHGTAANALSVACKRFAGICGLRYTKPNPRVEEVVSIDVAVDGKSRDQIIAECRKLLTKKEAPPAGLRADQ